ncbi:hypothetical protein [Streptomyces sp. NPDC091383]|uniref:hypothetical protein n=1 Tax=Streptomyces sp. NPDC091383 TaxID=3365996 RepID=UPI003823F21C
MATGIPGIQLRRLLFGHKVDRATATLPQTATGSIFTVSGGRVLVTGLLGEVTTAIGGTATTLTVVSTPTTGTATTLASATAITSKEVGAQCTLPLTSGSALVVVNGGGGGQLPGHAGYVVPVGNLQITTSASTTGSIKWSLTYVPLDDGASVTAA